MLEPRLGSFWTILRQVNLGEIHAEAGRPVTLVVAGPTAGAAGALAEVLRSDEAVAGVRSTSVVRTATMPLDDAAVAGASLVIAVDSGAEIRAPAANLPPAILVQTRAGAETDGSPGATLYLPGVDRPRVESLLAPLIVEHLGDRALAAARRLPILRPAYGEWLLNETSRTNAIYAFSTGVAESVPVLNIPLNMADVVILTKNQLVMVYKLALAAGRPMSPFSVIGELLGVIGAGLLWRQIARELVGLIPVVGIVPKVAVAYAGTYAVGQAAQTYLIEGEVPGQDQLATLYREAAERGQRLAQSLLKRNRRKPDQLDT